jgi:hypothetical protein
MKSRSPILLWIHSNWPPLFGGVDESIDADKRCQADHESEPGRDDARHHMRRSLEVNDTADQAHSALIHFAMNQDRHPMGE